MERFVGEHGEGQGFFGVFRDLELRRWDDVGVQGGTNVRAARRKPVERLYAQLAGNLGRPNLHPHDEISVLHRHADG